MKPAENDTIIIEFDGKKCIHARSCVLGLPEAFKPGTKGGWIFPDNASTQDLTRVIDSCPSGALTYTLKDNSSGETAPKVNTARLWENGPIELRGDLTINDQDKTKRCVLCRCGKSSNKPYCDNSHIDASFEASALAQPVESETPDVRDGPVSVNCIKDGPIAVKGSLEIIAGSGQRIAAGSKHFLCRCGASNNKPFCDGAHNKIKFKAD